MKDVRATTPLTARASLMNRSAVSREGTTPTSTTCPAYTATSTRLETRVGSAMSLALISSLISKSLVHDGRAGTKYVSTCFTGEVARAILTASVPAFEPGGTTPTSTTTA